MPTKRTPAELVAHRAAELAKSQRKLARAKDPTISEVESTMRDLMLVTRVILGDPQGTATEVAGRKASLEEAVNVLDAYIAERIERALAAE